MPTILVKWLNGEFQSLETHKGATVLKVIQQLGLSPAETTLFLQENVLEHYQKVIHDLELSILVEPAPVSIFLYQYWNDGVLRDCYFSSEDSMDTYQVIEDPEAPPVEAPFKLFDKEVVYDRVYFDMWSYRQETVDTQCSSLETPVSKYKGSFSMANAPYEFYSIAKERKRLEEEEGGLLRWKDFLLSLKDVSLRDPDIYFPTLTAETKRNGLFSRKEWLSYFVMAR